MAGASCGRSVLNSWASRRSGPVAASCSFRAVGLLTVSGKQYRPLPGLNSPLKSAHQRSFGRGAGRERRACTQRSRQPIGGRRKRVSRRGRFARASAGCQAGLPLGSRRRGGQPCWSDFGWANGPASGMGRGLGVAGRAASSDRACLPAPSRPKKLGAPAAIATGSPIRNRLRFAVVI
jgi:hypothetical protein